MIATKPRKQYTEEHLQKAVTAVKTKRLNMRQAMEAFGVPKATISDHINGKRLTSTPGPKRILDEEEENSLVYHLQYAADHGFHNTRQMLKVLLKVFSQNCNSIMSATRPKRTKIGDFSAQAWNLPKMHMPTC